MKYYRHHVMPLKMAAAAIKKISLSDLLMSFMNLTFLFAKSVTRNAGASVDDKSPHGWPLRSKRYQYCGRMLGAEIEINQLPEASRQTPVIRQKDFAAFAIFTGRVDRRDPPLRPHASAAISASDRTSPRNALQCGIAGWRLLLRGPTDSWPTLRRY